MLSPGKIRNWRRDAIIVLSEEKNFFGVLQS
jgi:hypothetical protein